MLPWSPSFNLAQGFGDAGRDGAQVGGEVLGFACDGGAGLHQGTSLGCGGDGLYVMRIELSGEPVAGEFGKFEAGPPGVLVAVSCHRTVISSTWPPRSVSCCAAWNVAAALGSLKSLGWMCAMSIERIPLG